MNSPRSSELEERIRSITGVIEAAVFGDSQGRPIEIQVWTRAGFPERDVRSGVSRLLTEEGELQSNERLYIFELTGESLDRRSVTPLGSIPEAPERPVTPLEPPVSPEPPEPETSEFPSGGWARPPASPESSKPRRPRIGKISLSSSETTSHAEVSLELPDRQAEGTGEGAKTPYALRVTAATTLEAAQRLLDRQGVFSLRGVSLVEVMDERMVVVIVESTLGEGASLLGAVLVGGSQVYEATVKATLDAVNRQLEQAL